MPRSLTLLLSGLLLLLAAAAAALLFRVEIANRLLPALLADAGYPGSAARVAAIGLHRAVLQDARLGPDGPAAQRIEIDYRLRGLLDGRIDGIAVTGLRVALGVDAGGIDWGPLAPLLADGGDGGEPLVRVVGPVRVEDARLALATPWGQVMMENAALRLRATPETFSGRLYGVVEAPTLVMGQVSAKGIRLPLALAFDGTGGRLDVRAAGCLMPEASRIEIAGAMVTTAPLELCPVDAETPLLRIVRGDATRLTAAIALRPTDVSAVRWRDENGPVRLSGPLPRLRGTLRADLGTGTWTAEVTGDGGDLMLSPAAVAVAGLDATLDVKDGDAVLHLRGVRLEDRAAARRFTPLRLAGRGTLQDGAAAFDGRLAAAGGKLAADLQARHDVEAGTGSLGLVLPATALDAAGLDVKSLSPALAGQVTALKGVIGAEARIGWRGGEITEADVGEIRLADVGFATAPAEVAGLSGTVTLSSLVPLATPPGQHLSIAFLDPGLPLVGGEVRFRVRPGPVLVVERAAWPFAGGTLLGRGVEIDLAAGFESATLDVEDVSIGELLEVVAVDDLTGTGRLSGRVPLVIEDGTPTIRNARLAADQGAIRYTSERAAAVLASQGGSAELLAMALRDFRYDRLVLTADGPLTGEITAGIELDGANPALYGGKPIELNVTLQGDLRPMIQSASVLKDLPERIRRQIEGGDGDKP